MQCHVISETDHVYCDVKIYKNVTHTTDCQTTHHGVSKELTGFLQKGQCPLESTCSS